MGKTVNSVKSEINIGRILSKYLKNWYLFALSFIIATLFAWNVNKYNEPLYSLRTSILIEDKTNSSILNERGAISSSPLFLNQKLIENQIALLKSHVQIKKIIEKLDFEVSYFSKGKYIWNEIYKESPFVVKVDTGHRQIRYKKINLKFISASAYEISSEEIASLNKPKTYKIGEPAISDEYSFTVHLRDQLSEINTNTSYAFQVNDINGLVNQYLNKTNAYIERGPSIMVITTTGSNKEKEMDYLNQLTKEFLLSNLDKKNQMLTNMLGFIDIQLQAFGEDLSITEQKLEEFRKSNQFMQLDQKIGALLKNLDSESKDRKNFLLDLDYYNYLSNYVKEREDIEDIVMPSSMGYNLPLFNDLAGRLSLKIQERDKLLSNSTKNNPFIQILDHEIDVLKESLVESMRTVIETVEQKISSTEARMTVMNQDFLSLPGMEREYFSIMRRFKIIDNLYDFLLKRKSEVELQRAANMPDHEIIDIAGEAGITNVSKNPRTAYMNAYIWAILLPSVFLFMLVYFNNRILAIEDITSNTDVSVIGTVASYPSQGHDIVLRSPGSYFTELFRIIRIKLDLLPEKSQQVVVITSSTLEEGKTFFAANMASVYALTGKKSLFVGFDFRSPEELEGFALNTEVGITNHLVGGFPLDQVVQKTFTKNLDILLSGPVPPNPDELIESDKTKSMFEQLRKNYDYIIIDTPPIGLFGDAYLLNKYSDATLFLVRNNFTRKREFVSSINEAVNNRLKGLWIVYNDVKLKVRDSDLKAYGGVAPKRFILYKIYLKARRLIIDFLRNI
ncbi:MAG: receptor protein-tyrosine [Bacteroidetes bacterium]|nr:MAG: receptor protein-tyrosine [Bacteroidota bacterium]